MDKDFLTKLEAEKKISEQKMKEWRNNGPTLKIKEGLKAIEKGAYANRTDIARVFIPEGVEEIGDEAFIFCDQLIHITLPSTLKRIGRSAFQDCVNLEEITPPEGLEEIADAAFCNCLSLEIKSLPQGVKIGELAFHHIKNNKYEAGEEKMTAKDFWTDFNLIFKEGSDTLVAARNFWNNRDNFTKFIMPHIATILSSHGYADKNQYEYYKIDVIGWKDRKRALAKLQTPETYKLKKHFWHLGVAVEHENDQTDWTDELVKLLYINCPLRIVIGYYPENLSSDDFKKTIDYASNIVALANEMNCLIQPNQAFMLILGENHNDKADLCESTYSAFTYNVRTKSFEEI